jgi:hypothetical protein
LEFIEWAYWPHSNYENTLFFPFWCIKTIPAVQRTAGIERTFGVTD